MLYKRWSSWYIGLFPSPKRDPHERKCRFVRRNNYHTGSKLRRRGRPKRIKPIALFASLEWFQGATIGLWRIWTRFARGRRKWNASDFSFLRIGTAGIAKATQGRSAPTVTATKRVVKALDAKPVATGGGRIWLLGRTSRINLTRGTNWLRLHVVASDFSLLQLGLASETSTSDGGKALIAIATIVTLFKLAFFIEPGARCAILRLVRGAYKIRFALRTKWPRKVFASHFSVSGAIFCWSTGTVCARKACSIGFAATATELA